MYGAYGKLITSPFICIQIFDLFDVKRKGVVDFGDFVRVLNVFHPNASQEDKIDCMSLGIIQKSLTLSFKLYYLDSRSCTSNNTCTFCCFSHL